MSSIKNQFSVLEVSEGGTGAPTAHGARVRLGLGNISTDPNTGITTINGQLNILGDVNAHNYNAIGGYGGLGTNANFILRRADMTPAGFFYWASSDQTVRLTSSDLSSGNTMRNAIILQGGDGGNYNIAMEGSYFTLTGSTPPILRISRPSSNANSHILYQNNAGSIYAGNATGTLFSIGGAMDLSQPANRWFSVNDTQVVLDRGQLAFPATQIPSANPNTLDDYEEGTWTPVFDFATPGDLTVTYTDQNGYYTKIGDLVYLSARVYGTLTFSTSSGSFRISGLPFQFSGIGSNLASVMYQGAAISWASSNVRPSLIGLNNSQGNIMFYVVGSGQSWANISASNITSGGVLNMFVSLTMKASN